MPAQVNTFVMMAAFWPNACAEMRSTGGSSRPPRAGKRSGGGCTRGSAPLTITCATWWASCACLSGPRSGDDQERTGETVVCDPDAMFRGPSLLQIELDEIGDSHGRIIP